jgi:hypothetical protein
VLSEPALLEIRRAPVLGEIAVSAEASLKRAHRGASNTPLELPTNLSKFREKSWKEAPRARPTAARGRFKAPCSLA